MEKAAPCDPLFHSIRLFYDSQDPFCQVELELVQSASGLRMYIDTFARPLSFGNVYPITLTIEEEAQMYTAELLEGGQRLLLPDAARDAIIDAMLNEQSVQMTVGPYQAAIQPAKFRGYFKMLSGWFQPLQSTGRRREAACAACAPQRSCRAGDGKNSQTCSGIPKAAARLLRIFPLFLNHLL